MRNIVYSLPVAVFILLSGTAFQCAAQNYNYDFLEFANKTYRDEIQTVVLNPSEDSLGRPVILINSKETLVLSFDVLGDMANIYNYTLIHCDQLWHASNLHASEYLDGYTEDQINTFRFSLNTLTPYVHHELIFPTDYMKPKLSGNYLLVVYRDMLSEENVLLTQRFYVVDPKLAIQANIPQRTRKSGMERSHQQIDVVIDVPAYLGNMPANAFALTIIQDGRTDNMVNGLRPSHTYPDKLLFEYETETLFEGGNQWRQLDLKSFKYQSDKISRIITGTDYFTVDLWQQSRRNRQPYVSDFDIQGRKFIKARSDQDAAIEGDYAWVTFSLAYEPPLTHGEMHILGGLTDWRLDKKSRMKYNFQSKSYEVSLFLKQGYYNYQFGIRETTDGPAETSLIEGSHWDTNHTYFLLLYFRKPGSAYDQLTGSLLINSH
ncbi:MAG TPA: DUF5103 domain-containing protein [Bacteroidales bacterium]|nr:DUF5103 domain-containing protein [Bacteroidales bacterium]